MASRSEIEELKEENEILSDEVLRLRSELGAKELLEGSKKLCIARIKLDGGVYNYSAPVPNNLESVGCIDEDDLSNAMLNAFARSYARDHLGEDDPLKNDLAKFFHVFVDGVEDFFFISSDSATCSYRKE